MDLSLHNLTQANHTVLQLDFARLELRQIKHVVQNRQQHLRRVRNAIDETSLLGIQIRRLNHVRVYKRVRAVREISRGEREKRE